MSLLYIKGGVQALNFWKHHFELWVWGDGLDMYPKLEGGFESMRAMLPISEQKMDHKLAAKRNEIELNSFDSYEKSDEKFRSYVHSNLGQKWRPDLF